MRAKKNLLYLLALVLGSCVPVMSLHPLYNEKDVVFDEKLLGLWVGDSNEITMEFTLPEKEEKTYQLIYAIHDKDPNEDAKGLFAAHLVKIENKLFLDVISPSPYGKLDEKNKPEWFLSSILFLPVHTFIRVDSIEPQLKLRLTDNDSIKKLLEKDPNAIKHEMIDGDAVLTADTKTLQKFVLKYADSEEVFSNELKLTRKSLKVEGKIQK